MKKRVLSFLLVLAMILSMLPNSVFAVTVGDGTKENPYQIGDTVTNDGSADDTHSAHDPAAQAEESEEGLPIHFFLASPGNIDNPNGDYINYGTTGRNTWPEAYVYADIKEDANWNQIKSEVGIRNVYDESIITDYVAYWPGGDAATFKDFGSVTIDGITYTDDKYEIKWVSIMYRDNNSAREGLYCQQYSSAQYEHIHIDGLLVEKIQPGEMEVYKSIPEAMDVNTTFQFKLEKMLQTDLVTPPASADAIDTSFAPMTLTATIAAGQTEAQITGGSEISFGYYKLTEMTTTGWENAGVTLTDSSGKTQTIDTDALYICIAPNGTVQYSTTPSGPYTVMNKVSVLNERAPVKVTYQWRIFNLDGSESLDLPAELGAHGLPEADENVKIGTDYVYSTDLVQGTSYYDYANGLLYTFSGWDTWSNLSEFGIDPTHPGYYALDDGDEDPYNNDTIEITADTWINGYWTVTKLDPADAYIMVHKDVVVETGNAAYVSNYLQNVGKMFISIDPGMDKDGDDAEHVDVDYAAAIQDGGYRIDVFQYSVPFAFTEINADVPGYTRTVTVTVTPDSNLILVSQNGDSAKVQIAEEYNPAQAPHNLGTVTYTNTYTKNVGAPVAEYPTLKLVKRATDSGLLQANAVFTLYSDSACTLEIASFTTNDQGVANIDFSAFVNGEDTYTAYLKETAAPAGYLVDNTVYMLTLTATTEEELRGNEFVQVTTYSLSMDIPTDSIAEPVQNAADETDYSLNVYNRPILGTLTIEKTATGLDESDKEHLEATVTIHGPIVRDAEGAILDLGSSYTLTLNKDNEWKRVLGQLPIGEYLIHENRASVHGYTWDMDDVDYGGLDKEVYNDITSGVFEITAGNTDIELTITNTYEKWETADFFIYKTDPSGKQLPGAVFQLYSDENCTEKVTDASITTSAVTGANGYAWFHGYTVPAGDADGIVTYYLKEVEAPAGHYLSNKVYRVDIKAVTDNAGTTTYEPKISEKINGYWTEADEFSNTSDTLSIVNTPVKGQITITKHMYGAPGELTSITLYVSGPNGYAETVELTKAENWTTTLTDLELGEYTVIEQNAAAPGYDLVTTYSVDGTSTSDMATVVLREATPGLTQSNTLFVGAVEVTNTYTRREVTIENPATLTIKKVGEDGTTPLAGAVFTLQRLAKGKDTPGENNENVIAEASFTTNDDGIVVFDLLTGFIVNGDDIDGKYILTETKAPDGYKTADITWTVTVSDDDGEVRVVLNDGKNIFENFWDWIVGGITGEQDLYTFENNVLTVKNIELADVTITKTFDDETAKNLPDGAVIEVAVFDSSNTLVRQLELSAANNWTARLTDIPSDTYTIRETSPSLHGYTWQSASFTVTGVDTKDVTTASSAVTVMVADSADVRVEIKNTYLPWESADFYVMKTQADGTTPLAGATFHLYDAAGNDVTDTYLHIDTTIHTNDGNKTGIGGILHFHGFKVDDGQTAVFTLKETAAPENYYANANVYQIIVSHASDAYDIVITDLDGNELTVQDHNAVFNGSNDVLTVVNEEILADLVIEKTFPESDLVPTSVKVDVTGPNGYSNTVTLDNSNGFKITLSGLSLGDYTIKEQDASKPGYALTVKYNGQIQDQTAVTLTKENENRAVTVTIQNTYTRNEEIFDNSTNLRVKKVGEGGEPLTGAEFTLDRMSADGMTVIGSVSMTTGEDGIVVFDLLTGFIDNDTAIDGTYILSETKAPDGYEGTAATWTVTVKEDNGMIRWELNENKNAFEGFWDWIVGNVSAGKFENGTLTVRNVRSMGNLTIVKSVIDPQGYYADAEYSFTLDCSDDAFDQTFTLKNGESKEISNIPYGTTYTLTENTDGAAYTSTVRDESNGRIWGAENRIVVHNTYAYSTHNNPLTLIKVDADDNTKVIAGAGFTLYSDEDCKVKVGEEVFSDATGTVKLPIAAAGTYYLKETTTPVGYHPNDMVYTVKAEEKHVVKNAGTTDAVTEIQMHITISELTGTTTNQIDYTYPIENTAIKTVIVSVEKLWNDEGYHARPEAVEVTLYKDNAAYETVTLNEGNNWSYTWDDLTDEHAWSVDESDVPVGYTKSVSNEGDEWTITNTRAPKPVEITVSKAWEHNGGKDLPESISVTLFKDGKPYETVALSEENDWTHTWEGLTDVSVWSVDETDVPEGYTKEITVDGYVFVITNTRTINPVEVSVTKVWVASEGVVHPESIEAVLYRDGKVYDTVKLSEENDWTHVWNDLTDEYTWTVDEKDVPEGYTKNVTNDGNDFTITNTKTFKYIDVSVRKVWYGTDVTHPASVKVTLYRNGEAYDTVTLSADNGWKYTWEDLTDEFEWEVDEPSVPSGYNKTVREYSGYNFTITNTHEDNPVTGDLSAMLPLSLMCMFGLVGFCFTATLLVRPTKEKKRKL